MAEVFGIVSGAVGIAGFVFQIADGIKKLANFGQEVKDAPADLQDALSELVDLGELYEEIGQQLNDQQTTNSATLSSKANLNKLLERSKRNHNDLQALLVDLEAEVRKRQLRGSFRAVLQKQTLARFQKRVKRTKETLQFSYVAYWQALDHKEAQSTRTEVQKILAVTPHISAIADQVSSMARQVDILVTRSSGVAHYPTAAARCHPRESMKLSQPRQTHKKSVTYRLRLPNWLLGQVYELAYSHSTSVWTTQFRVYNNVSWASPFLKACDVLDYDTVKNMLLLEPAHVSDQDEFGRTALHFLARRGDASPIALELLKLLVDGGADVFRRNHFGSQLGETPSDVFVRRAVTFPSNSNGYNSILWGMLNLLQFTTNIEDKEGHELESIAHGSYLYGGFVMETIQNSMQPPWNSRSEESRLSSMTKGYFGIGAHTLTWRDYEVILGFRLTSAVWKIDKRADRKLILEFMHSFGKTVRDGYRRDIAKCRKILRRAVRVGTSLDQASLYSSTDIVSTPLQEYLIGFLGGTPRSRQECHQTDETPEQISLAAVTSLATELQHLGLNLIDHGQQFDAALRNMRLSVGCYESGWFRAKLFRAVALQYGSQPEDWRLLLSNMYDEYLDSCHGDFWYMVEHPEQQIPGAWTQDAAEPFHSWEYFRHSRHRWHYYNHL